MSVSIAGYPQTVALSQVMVTTQVMAGALGQIDLTAAGVVSCYQTTNTHGGRQAFLQFAWRPIAGSWTYLAEQSLGTPTPDRTITDGEGGVELIEGVPVDYSFGQQITGLVAGTNYEIALFGRQNVDSTTKYLGFTGSAGLSGS